MFDDKELSTDNSAEELTGSQSQNFNDGEAGLNNHFSSEQKSPAGTNDNECKEKDEVIKNWKNEYDELYDKYLRLYSEFENFRRRTNKEKIELIDYANSNLILDILPVIDDFERAIYLIEKAEDLQSVKDGILHIYNKFKKVLEDKGLKEIRCIHEDFNPDLHDAISKIPAPKKKLKDKIIDQVQKGYYLKDKVIRHSKVVVGE